MSNVPSNEDLPHHRSLGSEPPGQYLSSIVVERWNTVKEARYSNILVLLNIVRSYYVKHNLIDKQAALQFAGFSQDF